LASAVPTALHGFAQHGLLELGEPAQVEPHAPLALQLCFDLRGKVCRWRDANQLPPDVFSEPLLEFRRGSHARRCRYPAWIPGDENRPEHGVESRVRISHPDMRQQSIRKTHRRFDIAQPLQVSRQHDRLLLSAI
jgi:hypothetical protein